MRVCVHVCESVFCLNILPKISVTAGSDTVIMIIEYFLKVITIHLTAVPSVSSSL